jgi:DNA modification methylase
MSQDSPFRLYRDDALSALSKLKENSIHSMVTDPPAGIALIGLDWDSDKGGKEKWIEWLSQIMIESHRVLKPGAHIFVWALPRTSHWTAKALEDAGFKIKDIVNHIFATGFPKSMAIDKSILMSKSLSDENKKMFASSWRGWGTHLKPAHEHWILAQKNVDPQSIAHNVIQYETGAINIDKCRVQTTDKISSQKNLDLTGGGYLTKSSGRSMVSIYEKHPLGRFPANLLTTNIRDERLRYFKSFSVGDTYVVCQKPTKNERGRDNSHPTVKPVILMRYLCQMITPKNGTILDPFMGSGTTGVAALQEGFNFLGIEKEFEYFSIAEQRIKATCDQTQFHKNNGEFNGK